VVQVHCDEGIAIHIGPEPCGGLREDVAKALVGERIGQPWSREKSFDLEADALDNAEGNRGNALARASTPLANVYLHYVFDLWADRWRRREATGDMIMVRYADDLVVGFQHENDARRFWDAMRERLRANAWQHMMRCLDN
jgi:hypothetical protein